MHIKIIILGKWNQSEFILAVYGVERSEGMWICIALGALIR